MRKRVVHKQNKQIILSNSYVRVEPIYSIHILTRNFSEASLYQPFCSEQLQTFITRLLEHETLHNSKAKMNDSLGHRYGQLITIMYGDELEDSKLLDFSNQFIEMLFETSIPYSLNTFKKGKANYLEICLVEREYYPEGVTSARFARRDIYKSSLTGRICKEEDAYAVLTYTKGTKLSEKVSYFSNKLPALRTANEVCFQSLMLKLKNWVLKHLESICGLAIEDEFSIPKLQKKGTISKKVYASEINKGISTLERCSDDFWYACKVTDCLDYDSELAIYKLLEKYTNLLKGEEFTIKREKRKIKTRLTFNKVKYNKDYFEFKNCLNDMINEIINLFKVESIYMMKSLIPVNF